MSKRVCLNCLKAIKNDLRCSRCRTARYCSENCQRLHYKHHKNLCVDSNKDEHVQKLYLKARNFFDQGNLDKAEKLYFQIMEIVKADVQGDENPDDDEMVLSIAAHIAQIYVHKNMFAESETLIRKYLDRQILLRGESCPTIVYAQRNLALTLIKLKRFDESESLLNRMIQNQTALGLDTMEFKFILTENYEARGDYARSGIIIMDCLEIAKKQHGEKSTAVIGISFKLATNLYHQRLFSQADEILRQTIQLSVQFLGPNHTQTLQYKQYYSDRLKANL